MKPPARLMALVTVFAFALSACGPILREGDKVVPKNEGGITLTYPFGVPNPMNSTLQQCELTGPATVQEFSTAPVVGSIVRLDGATCDGWTATDNVKPEGKSPGMTK